MLGLGIRPNVVKKLILLYLIRIGGIHSRSHNEIIDTMLKKYKAFSIDGIGRQLLLFMSTALVILVDRDRHFSQQR